MQKAGAPPRRNDGKSMPASMERRTDESVAGS